MSDEPEPEGQLKDYPLMVNAFELGAILAAIYDNIEKHRENQQLFEVVLKKIYKIQEEWNEKE